MRIIPAILTNSVDDLKQQVDRLTPYFQHFQVDIADGKFVPDLTVSLVEIKNDFSNLTFTQPVTFDFDLLVEDVGAALTEIDNLSTKLKTETVLIHNLDSFISKPNMGIAIDPQISVETIKQRFDFNSIPVIQIMSVIPGAQGRAFIPETLHKIEQLRKSGYKNKIYLDGGINNETIPLILSSQFQPDILCVGSYLSKTVELEQRVNELRKI